MRSQRFGGDSAQLLWRSLHPSSTYLGAFAGALGAGALLLFTRNPKLASLVTPLWACIAFAIISRVALDARNSGEMGSFLRGRGAQAGALGAALLRTILLNLCWLIPAAMIAAREAKLSVVPAMGVPPTIGVILPLAMLLPPLLLVVALGADNWAEMFQGRHWSRLLGGRVADLLQLYSTYLGSTFALGALIWSVVFGLTSRQPKLLFFCALVAASYQLGVLLLLLGRLIGGFLNTVDDGPEAPAQPRPRPLPARGDLPKAPAPVAPIAPAPAAAAPAAAGPARATAASDLTVEIDNSSLARSTELRSSEQGESLVVRLRQLERLAEEDPGRAVQQLTQLRLERGPHPMILARLAILEHSMQLPSAYEIAMEAVQLARQTGNLGALAELELAFADEADAVGIEESDWLRIAGSHLLKGREDEAADLYMRILENNPESLPSLKGLLKIAEARERNDRDLDGALYIYSAILRLSPHHSLAEFAERGRSALERRLLRSV